MVVLDALDEQTDLAPLASAARRPRDRRSSSTPAARTSRCCAAASRTEVTRIFDTQVAAGFAGLSAQAGYETLLREVLGVRVQKTASYTRWDRRPLDAEQLAYAREDVLHLLDLAAELERRLRGARAHGLGARGVPLPRGGQRRARRRHRCSRACRASTRCRRRARDRARAGRAGASRSPSARTARRRRC